MVYVQTSRQYSLIRPPYCSIVKYYHDTTMTIHQIDTARKSTYIRSLAAASSHQTHQTTLSVGCHSECIDDASGASFRLLTVD